MPMTTSLPKNKYLLTQNLWSNLKIFYFSAFSCLPFINLSLIHICVRFANEQGKAYDLIQAMKQNKTNYLILDQASFDAFNKGMIGSAIYTEENVKEWLENNGSSNPVMVKGETLEDLAKTLNLPEGSLTAAAEKYNADVAAGTDEFGRKLTVEISNDGPYYAVQMWLRYYATLGGLHINDQMQVLNTKQEACLLYTSRCV